MNKHVKHTLPRIKLLLMCLTILVVIMIWPLFYVFCDHLWLNDFRNGLVEELENIQEQIERDSLW